MGTVVVMVSYKEQCHFTNEEYGPGIRDSFRELLDTGTLFDVTLVSEDEEHVEAHRVILASGSTFFRNILCKIKHPKPFIYLKGIKKDELKQIMDFVYTGEATVAKDQLENFLESARDLKIKGLEKKADIKIENTQPDLKIPCLETPMFFNTETVQMQDDKPTYESKEMFASKENSDSNEIITKSLRTTNLKNKIMEGITKIDGLWHCTYCSKIFDTRARASEHVETHLDGFSHTCGICNKSTKTTKALKKHIERVHSYKFSDYLKVINNH